MPTSLDFMNEDDKCLLVTNEFGRMVQILLGFCAMGILFVKRELESPKRSFKVRVGCTLQDTLSKLVQVWMYDVSKQGIGALMIHMLNILLSLFMTRRSKASEDEVSIHIRNSISFLQLPPDEYIHCPHAA
jgi:hypothetical protein